MNISEALTAAGISTPSDDKTSKCIEGIKRQRQFVLEQIATRYCRAKLAVYQDGAPVDQLQDRVEHIKTLARLFNYGVATYGVDIESAKVADFICGFSDSREPSDQKVADVAKTMGVTSDVARSYLKQQQVTMRLAQQRKNADKHGLILAWLAEIDDLGPVDNPTLCAVVDDAMESALQDAYRQAAQYGNLIAKQLIEAEAKEQGWTLPNWAECLPQFTEGVAKAASLLDERLARRHEAHLQEVRNKIAELSDQFGKF